MNVLTTIRAWQRGLINSARKSALYDLHPELRDRVHVYSGLADRLGQTSDDYVGNARTFRTYVWVRKAVTLIAQTIAPLPVRVVDANGKALLTHPLTLLYANPNDTMPGPEFRGISIVHLMLGGERISEIVDDAGGRPRELWPRRPDKVSIRPDESRKGYPRAAEYVLSELATPGYDGTVPVESVIFEKFTNPLSDWRGLSPVSAVNQDIQIDVLAQGQRKIFYKNNARVEYALTAAETLTPNERERLELQVAEKYGGGAGIGKPMILEVGQDIKTISYPPKDMTTLQDQGASADRVAAIFGIPDILMGFGNDSYDTQEKRDAALSVLWALTLLLLVGQHDQTETHFWTNTRPMLRNGEKVQTDLSSVAVLQEDMGPKLDLAGKLFAFGVPFNRIDTQLKLNIGPIPGGDVGYLPMNLVPADELATPAPEPVPPKSLAKARRPAAARIGASLLRIRLTTARKMEPKVDGFFDQLASDVVSRARGGKAIKATLPSIDDLIEAGDSEGLSRLFRSFTITLLEASWETWNTALDVDIAFEQSDPAVVAALKRSGENITGIMDTTREKVKDLLQYGAEQGWTIDELVRGDDTHPGLRDTVQQTYKGRARAIARTELGTAQAVATVERYDAAGVKKVVIFDGGSEDSDDVCTGLNGTSQTLAWYEANPLQHPNCVRAAGPDFD